MLSARMGAVWRKSLDRDDLLIRRHRTDGQGARADGLAVNVHRTGAALGYSTAIFCACEPYLLADHPEKRRVRIHVHVVDAAIDIDASHGEASFSVIDIRRTKLSL